MALLLPLLKLTLLSSQPFLTTQEDFNRLQAVDRNNIDNEPVLLIAALSWGYLTNGNPAAYAVKLLYGLVATRFVHNIALVAKSEPLRTLSYLPAFFGTLIIGIQALGTAHTK